MDAAISLLAAVILPAMEVLHSVHHLGFLDHLDAAAATLVLLTTVLVVATPVLLTAVPAVATLVLLMAVPAVATLVLLMAVLAVATLVLLTTVLAVATPVLLMAVLAVATLVLLMAVLAVATLVLLAAALVAVTLVLQITAVAGVAATATQVAAELACALQALPLQPTFNLHLALFAVKLQTFFATHTPSSVALTRQLPNL